MGLQPPTLRDVLRAQAVVRRHLAPTPLLNPPAVSEHFGFDAYLKCENLQPIAAFKVRGGIYLLSRMTPEERSRGVVTASTGNHGQSIAYAARLFGMRAIVYAPEGANPDKVAAMRRLGAEVVLSGRDFDESRVACEARAHAEGMRYIHSANEPDLIAGVGTYALETIEAVPDLDAIIVPVGAGSGICGTITVMKSISPDIQVIGVQTEQMPVVYESWKAGRPLEVNRGTTFADGLATRVAFDLPIQIISQHVDDFRLVSEDELRWAIVRLLEQAHIVAEGAGAAAYAAAEQLRDQLAGKKVALVVSGGNITVDTYRWALSVVDQPDPSRDATARVLG